MIEIIFVRHKSCQYVLKMIMIERHASRLITDDRGGDFINRERGFP